MGKIQNFIQNKKENFIKKPNLPRGKVSKVLLGERGAKALYKPLLNLGISVIELHSDTRLLPQISDHTDMLCCHLEESDIVFTDIKANREIIDIQNICSYETKMTINSKYPHDIALNAAFVGNVLFCNSKYTDTNILSFAQSKGYKIADVKQGYAKCSICVVAENAIITDDKGIHKAAQNFSIDSLYIEKNPIDLYGFNYGFIGGCTGKLSKNTLAFTGQIKSFKCYKEILNFLNKYNVEPIYLTDKNIFDVGSIIPIKEIVDREQ